MLDALRAGARGFLTKDAGAGDIERALHAVLAGGAALDPAVHVNHILAKAGLRDRAQAVSYAYRTGLAGTRSADAD